MKYKTIVRYALLTILLFIILLMIFNAITQSKDKGSIQESFLGVLPKILIGLLVLVATKLFLDLSKAVFSEILGKIRVDSEDILKIWTYITWLIGFVFAFSLVVGSLSDFIVFLGLIAAGISFAMQTPLSSLVAWVMIILHKPFRVNDRIRVGEVEGDVIDITILYTMIREITSGGSGPTGKLITFPNAILLQQSIINYTLDFDYIWDVITVDVTYESDRRLAEKIIKESSVEVIGETMKEGAEAMKNLSIRTHGVIGRGMTPYIRSTPSINLSLKDSSFEVRCRYICKVKERRRVKTKIVQIILDRFKETEGVEIAYPHMEIITKRKI